MLCPCRATFNPGANPSLRPLPQPQTPSRAAGSFLGPLRSYQQHEKNIDMLLVRVKQWARDLKRDIVALWIAARDNRTPWYAKAVAAAIAAYALSTVDLIPDFIPVLGYLDELIVLPLGIALAIRLIPPELMAQFRQQAASRRARPKSIVAAVAIALVWAMTALLASYFVYGWYAPDGA